MIPISRCCQNHNWLPKKLHQDTVTAQVSIIGKEKQIQFVRTVDTKMIVGIVRKSDGGDTTTWIKIFTDSSGNLITTFPVPKP